MPGEGTACSQYPLEGELPSPEVATILLSTGLLWSRVSVGLLFTRVDYEGTAMTQVINGKRAEQPHFEFFIIACRITLYLVGCLWINTNKLLF